MGRGTDPGTGAGGGERIPTLRSARRVSLTTALGATALAITLGAIVATDADSSKLAWVAAGAAAFFVALGPAVRSSAPLHAGVAILGAALLLRQDSRLLLAPVYGAGLVLVEELGWRSIELAGARWIGLGVSRARMAAVISLVAAGACAAGCAATSVAVAPGRSVVLTAAGALAVLTVFVALGRYARHRYPAAMGRDIETADGNQPARGNETGRS